MAEALDQYVAALALAQVQGTTALAEADRIREVARARAEQEYSQEVGRAEGAAITAELAAHADHGKVMAQAGLEAASLTFAAVKDM